MKRTRFPLCSPLVMLVLAFGALPATAQPGGLHPILSSEGIDAARTVAASVVGADARLVFAGAVGRTRFDNNGMTIDLRFTLEDGRSTAWAYVFHSPSRKTRATIATIDIPGIGRQAMPVESPVPIPEVIVDPASMTLPYSGSETILPRLLTDSVFLRYRADLPGAWPRAVAYHVPIAIDSIRLATGFPLDTPLWEVIYDGAGDSAMVCYVSAGSGRVRVLRGGAVASVPRGDAAGGGARVTVARMGTYAVVRLRRDAARHVRGVEEVNVSLYDISGEMVSGPHPCGMKDGEGSIEIDLASLPPGVYYCGVVGTGWSAFAGFMR